MTREDIIRMAREAKIGDTGVRGDFLFFQPGTDGLEQFAALIAAAEREACAKAAEKQFEPEVWQRLEKAWLIGYDAGREAEREAWVAGMQRSTE